VGVLEITAAILLFAGLWVRYVGLGALVLFGGTLTIFLVAPAWVDASSRRPSPARGPERARRDG